MGRKKAEHSEEERGGHIGKPGRIPVWGFGWKNVFQRSLFLMGKYST